MATSNPPNLDTAHRRPRPRRTGLTSADRVIGAILVALLAVLLSFATAITMIYVALALPTGLAGLLLVWVVGAGVISASPTIADRLLGWLAARSPALTA